MRDTRSTDAASPESRVCKSDLAELPGLPWLQALAAAGPKKTNSGRKLQGIARVPTHAVGPARERRAYMRARMSLPLRVQRVDGRRDAKPETLHTLDISSSGVYFLSPLRIDPGTPIEIEVLLVDHRFGHGSVRMLTDAHIVRLANGSPKEGWHGLAAAFDEIRFVRDEPALDRYRANQSAS